MFTPRLNKGDRVALVCPSSPIPQEDIATCQAYLEKMGYEPVLGRSLREKKGGFMAGEARSRAQELEGFFSDESIKGIFCARGGDSALEVLQYLDEDLIRKNPKVFLGYSDITNLHIFLNQRCQLVTLHGPMVHSDLIKGIDDYSLDSLERGLGAEEHDFENPPGDPILEIVKGSARGPLVGGNLSLVTAGLGGPFEIDTRNKILFLEDINESVEHLHRMLWQLSYAGKFKEVKAVLLGDFNNCENRHDPAYGQDELFREFFRDFDLPVLMHIRSGHCMPLATLPLGAKASVEGKKIRLFI